MIEANSQIVVGTDLQRHLEHKIWRGCITHGLSVCWRGLNCEWATKQTEPLKRHCEIVDGLLVLEGELL